MRVALLVTHIRAEEKLILWQPLTTAISVPDIILDRELNFECFAGRRTAGAIWHRLERI